jgi:hypothetical protein
MTVSVPVNQAAIASPQIRGDIDFGIGAETA